MWDERTRFYYYDPFVNFVVVDVPFLRCITTLYYAICWYDSAKTAAATKAQICVLHTKHATPYHTIPYHSTIVWRVANTFFPVSFCFSPSDPHQTFSYKLLSLWDLFPAFFPATLSFRHSLVPRHRHTHTPNTTRIRLASTEIALHCNFIHFYFPILVLSSLFIPSLSTYFFARSLVCNALYFCRHHHMDNQVINGVRTENLLHPHSIWMC